MDIISFQSHSQCLPLPCDPPARRSLTCLKTSAQNILLHTYICTDMNITFSLHSLPLSLTLTLYLSSGNTFQMYPVLLRRPLYQRQLFCFIKSPFFYVKAFNHSFQDILTSFFMILWILTEHLPDCLNLLAPGTINLINILVKTWLV